MLGNEDSSSPPIIRELLKRRSGAYGVNYCTWRLTEQMSQVVVSETCSVCIGRVKGTSFLNGPYSLVELYQKFNFLPD